LQNEFNIPVGGVFCVTNYCFENAHKEFISNQKKAINLLEKFIREKTLNTLIRNLIISLQLQIHHSIVSS